MAPRPDLQNVCCLNPDCKDSGHRGRANLTVRKTSGAAQIRSLRCRRCGEECRERKGTALFNCTIRETQAVAVIEPLDRGCGLRATATLVGVAKDTVSRLVRVSGRVSRRRHDRLVRNVRPRALPCDEKWAYPGKKQSPLTPQDDSAERGDPWEVNGVAPQTTLLVTLVPGKRTAETIPRQAVADAAGRGAADAPHPAIFTDGESAYEAAILDVFGHRSPVPRPQRLGRPPAPVVRVPRDLVSAQVVKQRRAGRVIAVESRPICGKGKLPVVVAALGWTQANTSAIERFNLTDRTRKRRKARKTLSFSRRMRVHDWMSWMAALRYNFHHAHRALRQWTAAGRWQPRTPAMAAGLVEHR